jgi:hypothetical protein
VRDARLRIAVASSAKKDEVDKYLDIARITDLVDLKTAADDVEESKPAPDIFEIVLRKHKIEGADAVTRPTMRKQRRERRSRPSACFAAGFRRLLPRDNQGETRSHPDCRAIDFATTSRMREEISRASRVVRWLRGLTACEADIRLIAWQRSAVGAEKRLMARN